MTIFQFIIVDVVKTSFIVVGVGQQLVRDVERIVGSNGAIVYQVSSIAQSVCRRADWIAVDLDSLGGITRIFETLRDLRDALPATPVILLSRDFSRNDYGTHRLSLGDVSIRVPFTVNAFEIGLLQAQVNNKLWQARNAQKAAPNVRCKVRPSIYLVPKAAGGYVSSMIEEATATVAIPASPPELAVVGALRLSLEQSATAQRGTAGRARRSFSRFFHWKPV